MRPEILGAHFCICYSEYMADSFEPAPQNKSAATAAPAVPPSSSEVSVRTMASDLEMMGKSVGLAGQGLPVAQFERVAVSAPDAAPSGPLGVPPATHTSSGDSSATRLLIWGIVILVGAGILFAAGFYLYPLFGGKR